MNTLGMMIGSALAYFVDPFHLITIAACGFFFKKLRIALIVSFAILFIIDFINICFLIPSHMSTAHAIFSSAIGIPISLLIVFLIHHEKQKHRISKQKQNNCNS